MRPAEREQLPPGNTFHGACTQVASALPLLPVIRPICSGIIEFAPPDIRQVALGKKGQKLFTFYNLFYISAFGYSTVPFKLFFFSFLEPGSEVPSFPPKL